MGHGAENLCFCNRTFPFCHFFFIHHHFHVCCNVCLTGAAEYKKKQRKKILAWICIFVSSIEGVFTSRSLFIHSLTHPLVCEAFFLLSNIRGFKARKSNKYVAENSIWEMWMKIGKFQNKLWKSFKEFFVILVIFIEKLFF